MLSFMALLVDALDAGVGRIDAVRGGAFQLSARRDTP
jgi:hypothetical protein